jgi:hypothetical protein
MTNDPVQTLRNQLVGAAKRRSDTPEHSGASRRRWGPRRSLLLALSGLTVAGSSAAAVTGVSPFGSGTTPDGSTYTSTQFAVPADADPSQPPAGSACRRTDFRDATGALTTTKTACRTAGSAPVGSRQPLEVGFTVAPGRSLLIEGTVAPDVARVTVTGVPGAIQLVKDDDERLAFSVVTTESKPIVNAFDRTGHRVATYSVPL